MNQKVMVVIPVLNEEMAIEKVLHDIPSSLVDRVIVVDNGSTDNTAEVAGKFGAEVVFEPERGYGSACLTGIMALSDSQPDIVVFMDGDYSDDPREMEKLIRPIAEEGYDFVIGSRQNEGREKGALPAHSVIANRVFALLVRLLYGLRLTDIGSFKAIRYRSLMSLEMTDRGYGFPIEMVVKSARRGLKLLEVPTSFRKRIGTSKVTGNTLASIKAGTKIMYVILRFSLKRAPRPKRDT